ncbi:MULTISPECIES: hypothetical protein [Microbacterium]|uniref:hypothetical protein n=1 Tax=Microbacterium TaxID=33882 RepID=UPI00300FC197
MTNLTSLTISGGSTEPSLVSDLHTGDLPESLEKLRILDEYGRVVGCAAASPADLRRRSARPRIAADRRIVKRFLL